MPEPFQPDCFYHLFSHAVGWDNLFRSSENYRYFLTRYAAHAPPVVTTFAYCLMPNHFHFLVRIRPEQELIDFFTARAIAAGRSPHPPDHLSNQISQQLGNWLNAYAKAFNKRYQRRGRLFIESMRRKRIQDAPYLLQLISYIHWNPVHHGFVAHPEDWPYSSYLTLVTNPQYPDLVLSWFDALR